MVHLGLTYFNRLLAKFTKVILVFSYYKSLLCFVENYMVYSIVYMVYNATTESCNNLHLRKQQWIINWFMDFFH